MCCEQAFNQLLAALAPDCCLSLTDLSTALFRYSLLSSSLPRCFGFSPFVRQL